ncbi:MAG TPA: MFS transporter [Candidatus Eisenbacteria bacterium]|nr:MFS transporter [Candidatus Eisenbacteria bacterium]
MEKSGTRIPRNVIVVAFVALASGFGQDLITPVLPGYLALLGVSAAGIGLIDGLLQGATNVFRFVSGLLSDRFRDRKRLIFLGYALSSLARPLLAMAGSFGAVAALRLADGVGKGMKDAPRDALVADSSAEGTKGRAFGFHRLVDTAGSVLGPLVAAALLLSLSPSLQTYRLILLASALPGAVALGLIAFGLREPRAMAAASPARSRLPGRFWLFVAGAAVAMLSKINDSLFLVRAGTAGVPQASIPLVFAGFTLVYALLSYPIGAWSDRVGKPPFLLAGWLLLAAVEWGFSYDLRTVPALGLFALYGVFYALTEGSGRALIAELVPAGSRGRAYAVFYTLTGVAVIAGGWGLGRLWDAVSPAAAFRLSAAGTLLSCIFFAAIALSRPARGAPSTATS